MTASPLNARQTAKEDDAPPVPEQTRGAITLARHGRPDADRTVNLNWRGYRDWWANYDIVGLKPDEPPPQDILQAAEQAEILFSSTLPRARETARQVCNGREVEADPVFVEAPLPAPPFIGLVVKPPTWGVLSRICWWLGYSGGGESRLEAEHRAERAADRLVEAAAGGRDVMVFAHGWFNRMLRPALGRRGYHCVIDGGDSYWSFRRYEPANARVDGPGPAS